MARRRLRGRAPDRRGPLANLPRRAYLTWKYVGPGAFFWRILTFPLRFTRWGRRIGYGTRFGDAAGRARGWYRQHGRPVTVVIPTYGAPDHLRDAVGSVLETVDRRRTRVLVVDDASPPEQQDRLRGLDGVELLLGEENLGFAGNVNRGLRAVDGDAVVLNSDVVAHPGWLERLQFAAYDADENGIVGPKLLYPDGRIQSAGSYRPRGAPEWFDHRYRFRPAWHGPANVAFPALAMTGACLYLRSEVVERIGLLDEGFGMAYEDVDYCLRAWEAGFRVLYYPPATLTHVESVSRGMEVGEREAASQRHFWGRWGDWFDRREVGARGGGLRVIYVTEDAGVGGGHRDVFEHLNRLAARGHEAELYSLDGPPDWFDLRVPVRTFDTYDDLAAALAGEEAIKVATWWNTGAPVWRASVTRGLPVYLVQDIETSYYPDNEELQATVLASYREEFRFMTISEWNREQLAELGLEAALIPPGIDLESFRPLDGRRRRENVVLAVGRSNPLKNLDLTVDAWRSLPDPATELWMFGIEPELGTRHGARYIAAPSDEGVNDLFNETTVFVQTSRHEGFCLPALEAMAAGTAVVCTDAHGNRDFCRDGENCLMPEPTRESVAGALRRVLEDAALRERLGREGMRTAQDYAWERRIDALEEFLRDVAEGAPGIPAAALRRRAPTAPRRSAAPRG